MFRIFSILILTFFVTPTLVAEPFWGSKISQAIDTAPHKLRPGQFIWKSSAVPLGPMMAVVRLAEQKVYVYRNDALIGVSTVSTGSRKRRTPTGIFTVLNKSRFHRSKKYNNAPMPYAQWLTSKGIAMHAGKLPGYPASHGCIRMPSQFARFLFESSPVGMRVVITPR
jgi:lipoprotein-anchoring transpeptidase ErfK/SrfK